VPCWPWGLAQSFPPSGWTHTSNGFTSGLTFAISEDRVRAVARRHNRFFAPSRTVVVVLGSEATVPTERWLRSDLSTNRRSRGAASRWTSYDWPAGRLRRYRAVAWPERAEWPISTGPAFRFACPFPPPACPGSGLAACATCRLSGAATFAPWSVVLRVPPRSGRVVDCAASAARWPEGNAGSLSLNCSFTVPTLPSGSARTTDGPRRSRPKVKPCQTHSAGGLLS
jgi:hypothetical protein